MPRLTLICARATNGVIGRDGALPWHLPADLKRFKAITMGMSGDKPMIMGRKTFDSLGRPLPGRRHIVLTRDRGWRAEAAEPVHSVEAALAAAGPDEATVIGGADIFAAFAPYATRFELTEVHADVAGDTMLPPLGSQWREIDRVEHAAQGDRPAFAFVTLIRDLWRDPR